MAEDFNASVVITTADAVTGLRAVDDAAKSLDTTLRNLDSALKSSQGNLDLVSNAMASIVKSNQAVIQSETARAKATTEAAKADAIKITNQTKIQAANDKTAESEAKIAEIQRKGMAQGLSTAADAARKDAVARAAIDDKATVTAQKLATETERTGRASAMSEEAQSRLAGTTARTTMSQERLAAAQEKANSGTLVLTDSLSNSRYLLYDVAATYGAVSTALLAIPAATSAVSIGYQKDFAQVLRISDQTETQAASLRSGLVDLTTAIPESFGDATAIAQLGAHLQLGNEGLVTFTETVAKFAAATGVEVNTASQLFSRMKTSMADSADSGMDYFNKLGSSIAQMGTVVVATDVEVAAMVTQINAVTASAGIGTSATVGLAGAMASLRIQPEMARGALTRMFATFNRDSADATKGMDKFASVIGMSAQQAAALWQSDPTKFFEDLVKGLNTAYKGGENLTLLFDQMGIKNVRDVNTLQRLAVGYDVLTKSMDAADKGFKDGTALDELSKPIFETAAAKLQELGSAFQKLGDVIGSGSMAPLAGLADNIKGIVSGVADFAKANPAIIVILNSFMALAGVVGVLAAVKAAQALLLAGMISFQQVLGNNAITAGLTAKGSFMELAKTMLMMKGVNAEVAQSFVQTAGAMKAMGFAATATEIQVRAANAGLGTLGTTAATAGAGLGTSLLNGAKSAGSALLSMVGGPIGITVGAVALLAATFISTSEQAQTAGDAIAKAMGNGAQAAAAASADALSKIKVAWTDGIAFGNLDKSLVEVARDAGVPFDRLAAAATKGKDAGKEVLKVLDAVAQSKGFKSLQDLKDNSVATGNTGLAGQLDYLRSKVEDVGNKSAASQANIKDVASATKAAGAAAGDAAPLIDENGNAISDTSTKADEASKAIDAYTKALFGIVDAQAATQDSLYKLGEGLQKSVDVSPYTEGGRNNLKAYQDTIKNAALEQQKLVDSGQQSIQQASSNYGAFIDDLTNQLGSKGVNTEQIAAIANNAKHVFDTALQANGATLKVKVDDSKVKDAKAYLDDIVTQYGTTNLDVIMRSGGSDQVAQNVNDMEQYIQAATGTPYTFVANADTSAANENIQATSDFVWTAFGMPIEMHIDANTNPALQALQMLQQYAAGVINGIIDGFNNLRNGFDGLFGVKPDQIGHVGWGQAAPVQQKSAATPTRPDIPKAPVQQGASSKAQIDQNNANKASLDGLGQGYDNAADKAAKAGSAGKKAGQDAADGISEATKAAEDYASRLKTGLTSAYNQQYALTKATDDYHAALNAVAKKREADITALDDAILKQKTLNDERNSSLIDASKAGSEKDISLKYGENARAADYANQEQKALDAAAAKQKDITANNKTIDSLRAGIDNFNGYSDAAIANRAALRDLEAKMLDMISAYAATGASQEQVRAYAQKLTAQYQIDVGQIWQNRVATNALTGELSRYVGVVNAVPQVKPTTITADTGQAMGAATALNAALDWAARPRSADVTWNIHNGFRNVPGQFVGDQPVYQPVDDAGNARGNKFYNRGGQVAGFADGGLIPGQAPSDPSVDNLMAKVDGKGMVKVRSGEFIIQQPAVDFWGLDFFKQLNNMKMPQFNSGGAIGGGNGSSSNSGGALLVELTADNIAAILRLADRPVDLYANVEKLASTVNVGNKILASKGVVI